MGKKRPDLEDEESKKSPRKEKKSFKKAKKDEGKKGKSKKKVLPFDHKYIVAPMVGASELPFRLLCRKYGASLAYTPMMSANQFASSKKYRKEEFSTTPFDKPLVCHFAANKPEDFANAAKEAEPFCDAIDLNLGCPQRTAYVGHFGSYLLDRKDRELVIDIVRAGVQAVSIPIFVKIRLLDSLEETEELVRQLFEAGASLVAIHARFRATFHRNGPGARDGPALLDQVTSLRESFPDRLIVTNGNTITYEDVEMNLKSTKADGLMSAEGILDNPALFLPRLQNESSSVIKIKGPSHIYEPCGSMVVHENKDVQRYSSKIDKIERKLGKVHGSASEDTKKRKELEEKLRKVQSKLSKAINKDGALAHTISVEELAEKAEDKVLLAHEYLNLVQRYPATMRTVIFHIRRMIKAELVQYQLLEDCLRCTSLSELRNVLNKLQGYRKDPSTFLFDVKKANEQKEALAKKKHEEGKRKRYEERMIRKAKREGKEDIEFYLRQGASVPSTETIERLKALSKDEQIALWKELDHSQHCMMYHLPNGCARGRGCAFLHVDPSSFRTFDERDEVAG